MGSGYEIARAVTKLIRNGHPPEKAWHYTPRQLRGWVELIERERSAELADLMRVMSTAQSGDGKLITKEIKQLATQGL